MLLMDCCLGGGSKGCRARQSRTILVTPRTLRHATSLATVDSNATSQDASPTQRPTQRLKHMRKQYNTRTSLNHMTKNSRTKNNMNKYTLALKLGTIYNIHVQPRAQKSKAIQLPPMSKRGTWLNGLTLLLVGAPPKMHRYAYHPQDWGSENVGLNNRENESQRVGSLNLN